MATKKPQSAAVKLSSEQVDDLKGQMKRLVERNPSWSIKPNDYSQLF
jgi:hypothetical protein